MAVDKRTDWWIGQLRTGAKSDDVVQRLKPEMPLQPEFARMLPQGFMDLAILDVLPGPLTSLGNRAPAHGLTITQLEPQAARFEEELDALGLASRGKLVAGTPADAPALWPEPVFDLIVCRRADSLATPTTDLAALFACLRPGGTLFVSGFLDADESSNDWHFDVGAEGLAIVSVSGRASLQQCIGHHHAEVVWSMNSAGADRRRTWITIEIRRSLTKQDRIERELEDFQSTSETLQQLYGTGLDKADVSFTAKFFDHKPEATSGSIMPNDALFILNYMKMLRPTNVLEIGVSSGVSSAFMLKAAEHLGLLDNGFHLDSIDLIDYVYAAPSEPVGWAVDAVASDLKPHFNLLAGVTTLDLKALREDGSLAEPDLVFLDAEHAHPWPMIDLALLCDNLPEGVWVLLHDISLMERAIHDQYRMNKRPNWMLRGAQWAFEFWPGEKMRGAGEWANVGAVRTTKSFRGSSGWRALSNLPHETQITLGSEAETVLRADEHLSAALGETQPALLVQTQKSTTATPNTSIPQIFANLTAPCDKIGHYLPLYEQWFGKFVGRKPKILEIGVQFGGSAELWLRYFGDGASVVGVDIEPKCQSAQGFEIIVGDQGKIEFWQNISSRFGPSYFDIIIDDGSHENAHQITTLNETYSLLKNGGIYWCEDTHTSYYNGVRVQGGGLGSKDSFIEYTKRLADVVNERHTKFALGVGRTPEGPHVDPDLLKRLGDIQGVHFYDSVVVLEKGVPPEFERINSDKTRQPKVGTLGNPAPESFLL